MNWDVHFAVAWVTELRIVQNSKLNKQKQQAIWVVKSIWPKEVLIINFIFKYFVNLIVEL